MKYLFWLWTVLIACAPVKNLVADQTIPRGQGTHGEQRCNSNVPEAYIVSDGVGRWFPLHPRRPDGSFAPCAHTCIVENHTASCSE